MLRPHKTPQQIIYMFDTKWVQTSRLSIRTTHRPPRTLQGDPPCTPENIELPTPYAPRKRGCEHGGRSRRGRSPEFQLLARSSGMDSNRAAPVFDDQITSSEAEDLSDHRVRTDVALRHYDQLILRRSPELSLNVHQHLSLLEAKKELRKNTFVPF